MNERAVLLETAEALALSRALIDAALTASDEYGARLRRALLQAHAAATRYRDCGLADAVWLDTMGDIAVWCDNCMAKNHAIGLENIEWLQLHFSLELFRLGRLQYQIGPFERPEWVDSAKAPRDGQRVINIHISQGEPLAEKQVDESLRLAKDFFPKYFPHYQDAPMVCESWLLYPGNVEFMPEDCNILKFARRFDVIGSMDDPSQAIERIWNWSNEAPLNYHEDTALRRAAKRRLLSGGSFGEGFGILRQTKA